MVAEATGARGLLAGLRQLNSTSSVQSGYEDVRHVQKLQPLARRFPRVVPAVCAAPDPAATRAEAADGKEAALMLRFSLLRVPIAVHWSFLFIGVLMADQYPLELLVAFVTGVFIALITHELGHALTARAFGAKTVTITLFGLGGVTQYPADTPLTPGRRFLIAASGSAAGMTLGGALFLFRNSAFALELFDFGRAIGVGIVLAGLIWGALNWLPILPLDGGNMAWHALEMIAPKYALRIAKGLTIITAGVAAYLALNVLDSKFSAVFVAIIAFQGLRIPEKNATAKPRPQPSPVEEASLLDIFDDPPTSR